MNIKFYNSDKIDEKFKEVHEAIVWLAKAYIALGIAWICTIAAFIVYMLKH